MNIFHKLDIHYPGTDIRAEAQAPGWGKGLCFRSPPLPCSPGSWRFRGGSLCPLSSWQWWGYRSPIFPLPASSSPLTLKPLLLLAPG